MFKMALSLVYMPFPFSPPFSFFFFLFHIDLNEISTIITVYSFEHCSKCFYIDSHSILEINHFTNVETGAQRLYRKEVLALERRWAGKEAF